MSVSVITFHNLASVPSRREWESRAKCLGFDLEFDPQFNPESDTGFVPATLGSVEAGFEYSASPSREVGDQYADPRIRRAASEFDSASEFVWGASMEECAIAFAAAAVLADLTGGLMFDPQESELYPPSRAIEQARELVASLAD